MHFQTCFPFKNFLTDFTLVKCCFISLKKKRHFMLDTFSFKPNNNRAMCTVPSEIFNYKIAEYQSFKIFSLMFIFPCTCIPIRSIRFFSLFNCVLCWDWHLVFIQRAKSTKTSFPTPKITLSNSFCPTSKRGFHFGRIML